MLRCSGGSRISQRGAPTPKADVQNYYLVNLFPKTAWNWKNLDLEGGSPLWSDNALCKFTHWIWLFGSKVSSPVSTLIYLLNTCCHWRFQIRSCYTIRFRFLLHFLNSNTKWSNNGNQSHPFSFWTTNVCVIVNHISRDEMKKSMFVIRNAMPS